MNPTFKPTDISMDWAAMAQEGTGLTFLTGLTGGVGQAVPLAVIVGPPRDSMQAACERCPELRDVEVLR